MRGESTGSCAVGGFFLEARLNFYENDTLLGCVLGVGGVCGVFVTARMGKKRCSEKTVRGAMAYVKEAMV